MITVTSIFSTIAIVIAALLAVAVVAAIFFVALVCWAFKDMPDDDPSWEAY